RSDNTTITVVFDIPSEQSEGLYDVSVTFSTPNGDIIYTESSGFEVLLDDSPDEPDVIESVSPTSAMQGETDLSLTITLIDSVAPPPADDVLSLKIENIEGTDINRSDLIITAMFDIPIDEPTGLKDVSVEFQTPDGERTYTKSDVFTILPNPTLSDFNIVDSGQSVCYNSAAETACPQSGESFYG
ncbi:MAG: hypothetical protein GY869_12100, partial [Planctomycetes bacterium]|nr:hypothetical protein [Planctomycetota bacterium]